ncbi:S49 family peptidase [Oceanimonas sp. NS1]|nr:S49 family peptidase [Oceanimonas sp. NS1]
MEFLYEYGLFAAKALTWVVALGVIIALVAVRRPNKSRGRRHSGQGSERGPAPSAAPAAPGDCGERRRAQGAEAGISEGRQGREKQGDARSRIYVLDFRGSMDAREVAGLGREVNALLQLAEPGDEVLVRLESGGGVVHGYGLGAAELQRLKGHGLKLTVAVDKVAASGGYMMACVAERIIAAPLPLSAPSGWWPSCPTSTNSSKTTISMWNCIPPGNTSAP